MRYRISKSTSPDYFCIEKKTYFRGWRTCTEHPVFTNKDDAKKYLLEFGHHGGVRYPMPAPQPDKREKKC